MLAVRTNCAWVDMMKDKEAYKKRLQDLIGLGEKFAISKGLFVEPDSIADCEYWFSQIVTLIQEITFLDHYFYNHATSLIEASHRQGGIAVLNIKMLNGFLRQLHDAIDQDLLVKVEDEVTAQDFRDFLGHAKYYLNAQKKMESSVIASAIFEDSIRRVSCKYGGKKTASIEEAINFLKSNSVISSVEAKRYKYCAGIRNAALHASWDEFEFHAIEDLIETTSSIIEEYLAE